MVPDLLADASMVLDRHIPCCAVLVGEERIGLSASRRDRAFRNPVDSVLGVGVEHAEAVVVDRGAGSVRALPDGGSGRVLPIGSHVVDDGNLESVTPV